MPSMQGVAGAVNPLRELEHSSAASEYRRLQGGEGEFTSELTYAFGTH